MDSGTHHKRTHSYLQVPLQLSAIDYNFEMLSEMDFVYDSFCELLPECIKKRNHKLLDFDFEVDLYGTKPVNKIRSRYLLSSRSSYNFVFQYALSLKPHELNILYDIKGSDIVFARKSTILENKYNLTDSTRNSYYYNIPEALLDWKMNFRQEIKRQVNRLLDGLRRIRTIAHYARKLTGR